MNLAKCRKGIDISHWQGSVDFNKVKSQGFDFVIIKAGGADAGLYKDSKFEEYYSKAKAAGMDVGAYYFTGPDFYTVEEGKKEAEHFLDIIKGKRFEMPVWCDVEAVPVNRGKTAITECTTVFCKRVESENYFVGIYASDISGFKERFHFEKISGTFALWVARYNSAGPQFVKNWDMWQYGGGVNYLSSTKVNGVSSNACDQNYCNRDFPGIIKRNGLNGFPKNADSESAENKPKMYIVTVGPITAGDVNSIKNLSESALLPYNVKEV